MMRTAHIVILKYRKTPKPNTKYVNHSDEYFQLTSSALMKKIILELLGIINVLLMRNAYAYNAIVLVSSFNY